MRTVSHFWFLLLLCCMLVLIPHVHSKTLHILFNHVVSACIILSVSLVTEYFVIVYILLLCCGVLHIIKNVCSNKKYFTFSAGV